MRLTIGQLAERAGVATSALRYYESRGLISAERSEGNHRLFAPAMLRRVSLIKAAQAIGISLSEIQDALDALPSGRTPTAADWARMSARWRGDLDERIARLVDLRDRLSDCIGCGCLSLQTCAIFNPDDAASRLGTGARYLSGDSADDLRDPRPI